MYALIERLYPICRSITGNGTRQTLSILREYIPLTIHEIPTGTKVFDWEIPKEWNISDAYIKNSTGERVVDFRKSNLHVVNYSVPVEDKLSLHELKEHIFTIPEKPDLIPYRTSYYNETWGFCLEHSRLATMREDVYEIKIDSSLTDGALSYGELLIQGSSSQEVIFSTHICHPSLCNDNLSGISVLTYLAGSLLKTKPRYSYRFLFIPTTIGSIAWLAMNKERTGNIRHGLVVANVGDPGDVTYKKSRNGLTEIDRSVELVLRETGETYSIEEFIPYGYDERQYCSPGFNLPVGCFMRTPHGKYPEYHTSADNLNFVQPVFLENSFQKLRSVIDILETNKKYKNVNPYCEPQLGKRGLYKRTGGTIAPTEQMSLLWVLNLSDGRHSLLDIAERSAIPYPSIRHAAEELVKHELITEIDA